MGSYIRAESLELIIARNVSAFILDFVLSNHSNGKHELEKENLFRQKGILNFAGCNSSLASGTQGEQTDVSHFPQSQRRNNQRQLIFHTIFPKTPHVHILFSIPTMSA